MRASSVYVQCMSIFLGQRFWNRGTRIATVPAETESTAESTSTRFISSSKSLENVVNQQVIESARMNMKPLQLIGKLGSSKNFNTDIALKFDAGLIKSEKYGEATLSGHILLLNRHGEFPTVNLKQIEHRAYSWLNEIGLEGNHDYAFVENHIDALVAYSTAGTNPEKLEFYYKIMVFLLLLDDVETKLTVSNANKPIQHQKDLWRLAKSLISIIKSKGNGKVAKVASSTNPLFEAVFRSLSFICKECCEQMNEDEYTNFANELVDYFRVNKWRLEYCGSPFSESDYLFFRTTSVAVAPLMYAICLAKNILIPNEIIMHPTFQKYNRNIKLYVGLSNDILSVPKEIANNEEENIVLVKCREQSLQNSIYKTEKAINELAMDLRKDEIRLSLYFPAHQSLKDYIKTVKYMADGFLYWYVNLPPSRYGKIKFESYAAEYGFDYNDWLEKVSLIDEKYMEEPVYPVKLKNGTKSLSQLLASNSN